MSAWSPKRFWTLAATEPVAGGYSVRLDDRPVRTPGKAALILPTEAMAEAIAAEFQAQTERLDPNTMPCTRAANSAIDKVAHQFAEVVESLASYGGTDLLCYRAEGPSVLRDRQAAAWDPVLEWAATDLHAPLRVTTGVIPVPQPEASLIRLRDRLAAMTPFQIVGAHDLIALSGSLVLALAVIDGRCGVGDAWAATRIDEDWQAEQWGTDEEAAEAAALRHAAFVQAERFFALCG